MKPRLTYCGRYPALPALLFTLIFLLALLVAGCSQEPAEPLPVMGSIDIPYTFTDQDGTPFNQTVFSGRVHVADFFFTTCPTICPIMKTQMLRVYEAFHPNENLILVSHSIDPEHDTVDILHEYAAKLGISSEYWHMLTGNKKEIYDTARRYGLAALEDKNAPGGFIHSGSFSLIDSKGQIRGYYKGTEEKSVDKLIRDIRRLLEEE